MEPRKKSITDPTTWRLFFGIILLLLNISKTQSFIFNSELENTEILFSGANHYGSDYSFYSVCNRNNRTNLSCKVYPREPMKKKNSTKACTTDIERSVDNILSNIPMRLTAIGSRVILSYVTLNEGHRYLVVRVLDIYYCQFVDHKFRVGGPIPEYSIVAFKDYFDVFFKSTEGAYDVKQSQLTKVTFDLSGNWVSETKSFFAHIPESDLMRSNSSFCGIFQILPISFDNHGKGYYFITKDFHRILTLDPNGQINEPDNTVKVDFMLDPKALASGYGKIAISMNDAGINKLIEYNENLENVRNITYELDEGTRQVGIYAIGLDEYVLLSTGKDGDESQKYIYFSKIDASGSQSRHIRIKIDYPQDELHLTFEHENVCVNGAMLSDHGTYRKVNTVCLDRRHLNLFSS